MREFNDPAWKWARPNAKSPLHVLVATSDDRLRMNGISTHVCASKLPADAILRLDEVSCMPAPELLFVQMGEMLTLPALVMLGCELCGSFSRDAQRPLDGQAAVEIPRATTYADLARSVDELAGVRGVRQAREAIKYVCDGAASPPEAVLATIYGLPPYAYGYGMGPVKLNHRVRVGEGAREATNRYRYPDLLFSFAPVGINYDGERDHLDLGRIAKAARDAEREAGDPKTDADAILERVIADVRTKVIDDMRRNRELAAVGKLVLPMTKEDLYDQRGLDPFTQQLLSCASQYYGAHVATFEDVLNDSALARRRRTLLRAMLAQPGSLRVQHGLW